MQGTTRAQIWKPFRNITVLAPAYLDSVFKNEQYRYGSSFPKFLVPGNDFLNGAAIALDSLSSSNLKLKVKFIDSKSPSMSVKKLIDKGQLDKSDLIIGYVKEPEYGELAAFALKNKIPFVSANYPNDGGVRSNPYVAIIQSTLRMHCKAIHSYLIQNHGYEKILMVRPTGTQEDKVATYIREANQPDGEPILKIESLRIDSNYDALIRKLDSTRTNIIFAASLDEDFAGNIVAAVYPLLMKYRIRLIGMPNWEGFDFIRKGRYPQLGFYYTSSYFRDKQESPAIFLENKYKERFKGLPSEAAYKGFEMILYFAKLINEHPGNPFGHSDETEPSVFSGYNLKPVYNQKFKTVPDYYENEHIYLLKSLNGSAIKAW
jgi:hypothetical protein